MSANSCFFGVLALAAVSLGRFSALAIDEPVPVWSAQLRTLRPRLIFVEQRLSARLREALAQAALPTTVSVVIAPTRFLDLAGRFESSSVEFGASSYDKYIGTVPDHWDWRKELDVCMARKIDVVNEVAFVYFTSGTTSASKACCRTHAMAAIPLARYRYTVSNYLYECNRRKTRITIRRSCSISVAAILLNQSNKWKPTTHVKKTFLPGIVPLL